MLLMRIYFLSCPSNNRDTPLATRDRSFPHDLSSTHTHTHTHTYIHSTGSRVRALPYPPHPTCHLPTRCSFSNLQWEYKATQNSTKFTFVYILHHEILRYDHGGDCRRRGRRPPQVDLAVHRHHRPRLGRVRLEDQVARVETTFQQEVCHS